MDANEREENLTQSKLRPVSPFSYVGQGRKDAKVKTEAGIAAKRQKSTKKDKGIAAKERRERKENKPKTGAYSTFRASRFTFHSLNLCAFA
jgi:hypothetical protein